MFYVRNGFQFHLSTRHLITKIAYQKLVENLGAARQSSMKILKENKQ